MKRTVFRYYEIATEIKLEPYKRAYPNDRRLGIQALRKDHETLTAAIIEAEEGAVPTAEFASADAAIAHLHKHFPEMLVQDFGHYARILAATVEEVELTVEDGTVMDCDNLGTVEMSAFPAD